MNRAIGAGLVWAGASLIVGTLAFAQLPLTGAGTKPAAGGGSPTLTPRSATVLINNFAAGTQTITNLNGGTNFPAGVVYVFAGQNQSGAGFSGPQIGGQAATLVAASQNSTQQCQFYHVTLGSPAADTFSFTNGNAVEVAAGLAFTATGVTAAPSAASTLEFGSSDQPIAPAGAITVPSTGFGMVALFARNTGILTDGANTPTWTNTTAGAGDINVDPAGGNGTQIAGAHTATSGSWTPTASATKSFGFISCLSTIAIGP